MRIVDTVQSIFWRCCFSKGLSHFEWSHFWKRMKLSSSERWTAKINGINSISKSRSERRFILFNNWMRMRLYNWYIAGSCRYATCSLGDWSEWEPKELKEEQCGQQQKRKRTYTLTFAYQMHAEKCPSLPQTCPDDIVEKRTQCKTSSYSHVVDKPQIWAKGINRLGNFWRFCIYLSIVAI